MEAKRLAYDVLKGGIRCYRDDAGELRVWAPAPTVMATIASGRLSLGLATAIAAFSDEQAGRARPGTKFTGLHDWGAMTNYDRDARKYLVDWTLAARARIAELHFLVTSSFVHMALSVGNLALTMSIHAYRERAAFEAVARQVAEREGRVS